MKTSLFRKMMAVMLGLMLVCSPSTADAQNRKGGRTQNAKRKTYKFVPKRPEDPTHYHVRARTLDDLLFFPYAILPSSVSTAEEARATLIEYLDTCEVVNLSPGIHGGFDYDYAYKGASIGVSYHDWYDNRQWYEFYFDTRAKAQQFYTTLTTDLRQAGFPMVKDKIYGGMTTRNQSVALFKEIYVFQPNLIKKADSSNIHREDVVGKYVVELGVYWR